MAQLSVEEAFPVYRKRCGELFDENLLLRAQVEALERRVAELEQQHTLPQVPLADAPPDGQGA